MPLKSMITTSRENVATQLVAYGEDSVAARFASASDEEFVRIQERAFRYAIQPDTPSGRAMFLDKALALAAIEVLEGAPRALRRSKRVYGDKRPNQGMQPTAPRGNAFKSMLTKLRSVAGKRRHKSGG